jgi:hypothetical protein
MAGVLQSLPIYGRGLVEMNRRRAPQRHRRLLYGASCDIHNESRDNGPILG